MLVREVMTTPAITIASGTSVHDVLAVLDQNRITALPVVDDHGDVIGVVSEADLVRDAVLPDVRTHMTPLHLKETPPARRVDDVMTRTVLTVSADSDLVDAVDIMTSTVVKSLPVVDDDHRLVGGVCRRDVVHLLARRDDSIRQEVADLVRTEGADWIVDVSDGVVRVTGPVGEKERRIAEVLAGCVSGVVAVQVR